MRAVTNRSISLSFWDALAPSPFDQKWIALALLANGRQLAMSGHDDGLIRQSEYRVMQRANDFLHRTAGQISPPNRAGKQRVARDQLPLGREVKADAPLRVSGRVQNLGRMRSRRNCFSRRDASIDLNFARWGTPIHVACTSSIFNNA